MKKLGNVSVILVSALLILVFYTFLHEGGHALFAVIFGGKITEFNINFLGGFPHVSWGGEFGNYKRAVISIAGPLIPYVLWVITVFMLRKNQNNLIKMIMFIASMGVLGSFIPNIIIHILFHSFLLH
jgi:membrane-associated protease RseP (regulator of RpoE activity)